MTYLPIFVPVCGDSQEGHHVRRQPPIYAQVYLALVVLLCTVSMAFLRKVRIKM